MRLFSVHYLFVEILNSFCLATIGEQQKSWKIQLPLQANKIGKTEKERERGMVTGIAKNEGKFITTQLQ